MTSYDACAPFINKHLAPYIYTGVHKVTAAGALFLVADPTGILVFRSARELAIMKPAFASAMACAQTMVKLSQIQ